MMPLSQPQTSVRWAVRMDPFNLRNARLGAGLTQDELASKAGVSPSTLERAARGDLVVKTTASSISAALDVLLETLLVPQYRPQHTLSERSAAPSQSPINERQIHLAWDSENPSRFGPNPDPDQAPLLSSLDDTRDATGRLTEAMDAYRQAIAFRSDKALLYSNLSSAFTEIARYDEALATLRHLLRVNETSDREPALYPAEADGSEALNAQAAVSDSTTRRQLYRMQGHNGPRLSPLDFIRQHYAAEIAANALHWGIIHRDDPGLYITLKNWLRTHTLPADLRIPSLKDWNTSQLIEHDISGSTGRVLTKLRQIGDPKVRKIIKLYDVARKRPLSERPS
jgi:transcriptional regulator with XRE-family HTH domain